MRHVSLPWDCSSRWSGHWIQNKGDDADWELRTPTGSSLWSCDPRTHGHIYDSATTRKYKFDWLLHLQIIGINAATKIPHPADTHHQVEGSDSPVSWARVQQPVVDLHGVHRPQVALECTLSGQIVLTVVRGCICETQTFCINAINLKCHKFSLKRVIIFFIALFFYSSNSSYTALYSLQVVLNAHTHILRKLSINHGCTHHAHTVSLKVNLQLYEYLAHKK